MNVSVEIFSRALAAVTTTPEIARITPLVPEASTRRYYRLTLVNGSSFVAVLEDSKSATANMPLVSNVQNFLQQHQVAVPEIYFSDPQSGVMLQQDLGDQSLMALLLQEPNRAEIHYKNAINHMLSWQRLARDTKCPAYALSFDVEKLMFEFEFFITNTLLGYYQTPMTQTDVTQLRAEFAKIAEALAAPENKVFTHRDCHSRNIMIFAGKQYIIDFQDARLGLMQYDLCSLLCDAYAPMDSISRAKLIDFTFDAGADVHRQTREQFDYYFTLSAFQRLVKAMGTFGRQATLGRDDFAAYLIPARQMLTEISRTDGKLSVLAAQLESMAAQAR